MKALRKMRKGYDGVELVMDMPIPEPGPGEVRIKIIYAAVCGTDSLIRNDGFPTQLPVTIGHEYSGIVDKLGEGVENLKPGDRVVSMTAARYCGKCELCRRGLYMLCEGKKGLGSAVDGAFAEYMTYPADRCFILPDDIGFKEASLCEPMACVVRGVLERSPIKAGDYVYISGPGVMGQFAAQFARIAGANVTVGGTGIDAERLALARELGADHIIDITAEDPVAFAKKVTGGHMYDICIECSSSPRAYSTCIDIAAKAGHIQDIAMYGTAPVPIELDRMLMKELSFSNSYASERTSWLTLIKLLSGGRLKLDKLCSNIFPLEEWETAFDYAAKKIGYKTLFKIGEP